MVQNKNLITDIITHAHTKGKWYMLLTHKYDLKFFLLFSRFCSQAATFLSMLDLSFHNLKGRYVVDT